MRMWNLNDFPDCLLVRIFKYLGSRDHCLISGVCRRWYCLAFDRDLWVNADLSPLVAFSNRYQKFVIVSHLATISKIIRWNLLFVDSDIIDVVLTHCVNCNTFVLKGCKLRTTEFQDVADYIGDMSLNLDRCEITCMDLRGVSGFQKNIEKYVQAYADSLEILGFNQFITRSLQEKLSSSFHRLKILDLAECYWVSDSYLQQLSATSPNLESLSLCRCVNVCGSTMHIVLQNCPKLRTLVLRRTKLKDEFILRNKWDTAKIQELDISHCYGLDEEGISHVLDSCSEMTYLRTAVTDQILHKLAFMSDHLKVLEIRRRYPVAIFKIRNLLCNCQDLRSLDISLTPIEASFFEQFLPFLANLETISFAGHEVLNTYQIVDHLASYCQNLRSICINYYHAHNDSLLKEAILRLIDSCKFINRIAIQGLYVQGTLEELRIAVKELGLRNCIDFSYPHKFKLPRPDGSIEIAVSRRERENMRG